MPAPLPTLRLPTLSTLILPLSSRTRTPMASPCATPESFTAATAASADASSLKIAKTTVLFDMTTPPAHPSAIVARAEARAVVAANQPTRQESSSEPDDDRDISSAVLSDHQCHWGCRQAAAGVAVTGGRQM